MANRPAAVRDTAELARIRALPRRTVSKADAARWAEALTPVFARRAGASLLPAQGIALAEAACLDDQPRISSAPGAILGYPVGTGKTLIFELLPALIGAERPILIMPSGMRDKTLHERPAYAKDWKIQAPRIVGDRELMLDANDRMLEVLRPDLIMIDEVDMLANPEAAAPARIDRYVTANWDSVRVVGATGTLGRNSILDDWHILMWCLKDDAPVPTDHAEALMWSRCLDNRVQRRIDPGPLGADLKAARTWARNRFVETPGVLMWDEDSAAQVPLTIRTRVARECPEIDAAFETLLKTGENPAGIPVVTPLDQYRMEEQIGSGICQYWDPPPPDEWRQARRAAAAFCRNAILYSRRGSRPLDTEGQVYKRYADDPVVRDWLELKPSYSPEEHTHVMWISDAAIESCVDWLGDIGGPGIVWTGIIEFGEALARRTGLSYYGAQGKDQFGNSLLHAPADRPLIASHKANKRGYNLQAWPTQLICQMPQSGKYIEQTLGRGHRHGATKAVVVDVLATSGSVYDALERGLSEAAFQKSKRALTQKILRAGVTRIYPESKSYRWARGEERFDPRAYGL